jgi:hypothetical protein
MQDGRIYPVDPFKLFEEITFDPRMDETVFNQHKGALLTLGVTGNIAQSSLYKIGNFEARLQI